MIQQHPVPLLREMFQRNCAVSSSHNQEESRTSHPSSELVHLDHVVAKVLGKVLVDEL